MDFFKVKEEFSEKVKEFDNYILSKKKLGVNDFLISSYIIEKKLLKNKCKNCLCEPIWKKKPLTLILDRIDNRLENNNLDNLRFLCPNCYSQIRKKNTLLEKNTKAAKNRCIDCNKLLKVRNISCPIERDSEKDKNERSKRAYAQSYRCRICLEKLVISGQNTKLI
mgnify:CR=1 FL=1